MDQLRDDESSTPSASGQTFRLQVNGKVVLILARFRILISLSLFGEYAITTLVYFCGFPEGRDGVSTDRLT
ncbi:unnamed protein product [Protopolystoma xenopodis]|uniref:Uncharacterized protein n=1 Tax=Protopolystoma xenopodis TaxID=117903 RepID=A0A3S5BBQ8_9PLAT|nr:unnamed protein product [Protopolystoma xenopodis]